MVGMILSVLKGWITKELLVSLFRDVIMDVVIDELKEAAADTTTSVDDKLVAELQEWLKSKRGVSKSS